MHTLLLALALNSAAPTTAIPLVDWGRKFSSIVIGPAVEYRDACTREQEAAGESACFSGGAPDACGRGCILWQVNCGVEYLGRGTALVTYQCVWHTPPLLPPFGGTPRPLWEMF